MNVHNGIFVALGDDEVRAVFGLCVDFGNVLADNAQAEQLQAGNEQKNADSGCPTGSPKISRRTTTKRRPRKETSVIRIPNQEAILSGACEKLMMPSMA